MLNVVMLQTSFYLPRGWLYLSLLVEVTLGVLVDADPHQRLRRPPSSVSYGVLRAFGSPESRGRLKSYCFLHRVPQGQLCGISCSAGFWRPCFFARWEAGGLSCASGCVRLSEGERVRVSPVGLSLSKYSECLAQRLCNKGQGFFQGS